MKRILITVLTIAFALEISCALLLGQGFACAVEPAAQGLLEAARGGDVAQVQHLLASGVDVDVRDENDNTALHLAAGYGYTELARLLVHSGADVDARGRIGNTPLHLAAQEGYLEIVRLLVDGGTDVAARNHYRGTALELASGWGHGAVAEILQEEQETHWLAEVRNVRIVGFILLAVVVAALVAGVRAVGPSLHTSFGQPLK